MNNITQCSLCLQQQLSKVYEHVIIMFVVGYLQCREQVLASVSVHQLLL